MLAPRTMAIRWVEMQPTPWRNGGGLTRELAASPTTSGAFDWRVSIADIETPGPFSRFAGMDRIITVLEGGPMTLVSETWESQLTAYQPHHFTGEDSVTCRLPHGPARALNLMTRRGRTSGVVLVRTDDNGCKGDLSGGRRLLVALEDGLTARSDSGQTWVLAQYDVLDTTEPITSAGAPFADISVHA